MGRVSQPSGTDSLLSGVLLGSVILIRTIIRTMLFQVKKFAQAQNCLLPMGVTSENVAQRFGVSRQEQDQAAVRELNFFSMVVF